MNSAPSRMPATPERVGFAISGGAALLLQLLLLGVAIACVIVGLAAGVIALVPVGIVVGILVLISFNGLFILQPNQAMVLVLFGRYKHTVKQGGWYWVNPLMSKREISLRVHNFNSQRLKVNDADGNPIEIAAVAVWRVTDTARASFDVENYGQFIEVQSETALRHLASKYPYDQGATANVPTLRGSTDQVSRDLQAEVQNRLTIAGIDIIEARLTHLAYSSEIAGAMLQRQQAAAIIAARQRIAAGAVGIVDTVLASLKAKKIVDLTPQQKAEMVSSLLIVLTSDRGAQPVLQTG